MLNSEGNIPFGYNDEYGLYSLKEAEENYESL
jgi:hypothetical protein